MPSWKKVILSGSDASLNSLYVNGPITGSDIKINDWGSVSASLASIQNDVPTLDQVTTAGSSSTNDIFVSSSKSYYLGANSYLRRETNSGGFESIQLNGSIFLKPNTAASANNGVVIGGNGYLLSANSSRNAQLNYGSVSGQMGIYKLNVYGADSIFQYGVTITGSLNVTGGITGSDVQIDDWGSVSASLASIEAGVATQTLQDVTDNGNTTTNSIAVTGFTSSITGGDGITGTFRSTNGYNRLFLISTGSSGTNFGQVNIVLRDSSGASNNDGTISYGGGQSATFSIKTANDNEIKLQGTTTDHVHSFSNGGTGSLVWNSVTPFIQRTGSGQTQFLGLATSASYASQALSSSFATSASYVASASYTPNLQQVLNSGNSATNSSLYLKGTWNNVLQIGNDIPTTAPLYAITASVGLGLHGTQIYWSGSIPDGSNYSAIVNKSVDQFQTDNDTISVAGKLFVFSGLPIDEGFHSVHCDYVLMGVGVGGTSVTNVKAGTIIVAVDDSGNISYNEYSTTNTNGNISDVEFIVENVAGFIQCWISNTAGFNAVKSRVTFL